MLLQMVLFHSLTPWKWKRQWLSHVWNELGLSQLFATLWTVALQAPLPMGSSRQEYWSGVPFPSLGDLPKSGIKPRSPALAGGFLTTEPPGKPKWNHKQKQKATYTIGSTFKIYLESTFLPTHHSDPNHHFSPGYSNSLLTKLPLSAPLTAESPWGGGSGPTERRSGPISLGSKSCSGFSLPAPAPLRAVLTCPLHLQAIPQPPRSLLLTLTRTPHFRAFGLALSASAFSPAFLHGQLLTPSSGLCSSINDTPAPAQWKQQAPPFQPVRSATLLYFLPRVEKYHYLINVWHLLHAQWMFPEWMNTYT